MLKPEKNYDFRKSMCKMHKRIMRDAADVARENELLLPNELKICLVDKTTVASVAAKDFIAYMKTAFGIRATLVSDPEGADIVAAISEGGALGEANGYMGRKTSVTKSGVRIDAFDERGIAQGFYGLEERMNERRAPCLELGVKEERPIFSPRMVHSGYGIDEYPDEYLSACAHHGYDAIIIFVKDATHSAHGECDFNDIVARAAKYGIDTYAYSYLKNFVHPSDPGAKEIYGELYGGIFREIKGLRGMIFVGESIEFPSKDPNVCPRRRTDTPADGLPDGRKTPGWWPCNDYPEWLSLVRDSIRAVTPDADVVFWTYNFGYVDKEHRLALIDALPTDVSLLVTFEMFEKFEIGGTVGQVMDYTASFPGPGAYYTSEAERAKERGIRLYSMVNTAGRTWDYGVAPYEPFPYLWNERYKEMLKSSEKHGLVGLMESHHFGFTPSFITEIAKSVFTKGADSFDEKMAKIAKRYAPGEPEKFIEAMKLISESNRYYVPSDENQYGPFRIGPAYPLCLCTEYKLPNLPGAHFGNGIYYTMAGMNENCDHWGKHGVYSVRIKGEIERAKKTRDLLTEGLFALRGIKKKNAELKKLINLIRFLIRCNTTAINAKLFYIERHKLFAADTKEKLARAVRAIERIAKDEIDNAEKTIPLVMADSAIGFEPSMLYQCDERGLLWKIKQVRYMVAHELACYRDTVEKY